jgi:hypothetical protein
VSATCLWFRGTDDKHYRSLFKTVSWWITQIIDRMIITFLITENMESCWFRAGSPAKRHTASLAQAHMADRISPGWVGQAGAQRCMAALGDTDEKNQKPSEEKNTRANHNDSHRKFMFRAVNKPNGNTHVRLKKPLLTINCLF